MKNIIFTVLCLFVIIFQSFSDDLEILINRSPLLRAINGDFDGDKLPEIRRLINNGYNVNSVYTVTLRDESMNGETETTPLIFAIGGFHFNIARYLISVGANYNYRAFSIEYNTGRQAYTSVLSSVAQTLGNATRANVKLSETQNFVTYFFTLNPNVSADDIGYFADVGVSRFVMEIWNRLDDADKPQAINNIIIGSILGAVKNRGQFTQNHEYLISFALRQDQYINIDHISDFNYLWNVINSNLPDNVVNRRVKQQIMNKITELQRNNQ